MFRFLLALLLFAVPVQATEIHWLYWTNPCNNAAVIRTVDPGTGDSTNVYDCLSAGTPLHDLASINIYGWPAQGGGPRLIAQKMEAGMECRADSIPFNTDGLGWHFYIVPVDTAGNGACMSNVVYIGPVTGVPTDGGFISDPVAKVQLFDVRGRLVTCRMTSGIYFEKRTYRSGRVTSRRIVFVK